MTNSPITPGDSLAEVVEDLLVCHSGPRMLSIVARIERLDAKMRMTNEELSGAVGRYYELTKKLRAKLAACEPLVAACEAEFDVQDKAEDGELLFPDEDKVSYPEDSCHITFGMIRKARTALAYRAAPDPGPIHPWGPPHI